MNVWLTKTSKKEATFSLSLRVAGAVDLHTYAETYSGTPDKTVVIYGLPLADLRDLIEQLTARVAEIEEAKVTP